MCEGVYIIMYYAVVRAMTAHIFGIRMLAKFESLKALYLYIFV